MFLLNIDLKVLTSIPIKNSKRSTWNKVGEKTLTFLKSREIHWVMYNLFQLNYWVN